VRIILIKPLEHIILDLGLFVLVNVCGGAIFGQACLGIAAGAPLPSAQESNLKESGLDFSSFPLPLKLLFIAMSSRSTISNSGFGLVSN